MVEVPLKIKFDGSESDAGFAKIKSTGSEVAASLKGAFAMVGVGLGLGEIVNSLKATYAEIAREESAWMKLNLQVTKFGASGQQIDSIRSKIEGLKRATGTEDEDIANAFARMLAMTGDVAGALDNLSLVMDVNATYGKGLEASAAAVANVMTGQLKAAGQLVPELKNLVRENGDLTGSAEGAALAMGKLREAVVDAEKMGQSGEGSARKLSTALRDLGKSAFEAFIGFENWKMGLDWLKDKVDSLTDAINRLHNADVGATSALVSAYPNLGYFTAPDTDIRDAGLGMGPRGGPRPGAPSIPAGSPGPYGPDAYGPSLPDGAEWDGSRWYSKEAWQDELRGAGRSSFHRNLGTADMSDSDPRARRYSTRFNRGVSADFSFDLKQREDPMKGLDEERQRMEQALQDSRDRLVANMESAFSAMRGGWKSSIDWMASYMLKKLVLEKIANAVLPGSGAAAAVGKSLGGGQAYGAAGAAQRAMALRASRG